MPSYTLVLYDLAGVLVADGAPFIRTTARWELDGPGSLEVDLREDQVGSTWVPGQRRVVLRRDAAPIWGGWLLGLEATFDADRGAAYTARCLGHAAPLAHRVVLGDFSRTDTVATQIAWDLISHAQAQPNGNLGITLGTVVGTAPTLTRHYCDGDRIGEAIDELASREPGGFDWEVDAQRAWNAWVGGRGTNKQSTVSFGSGDVQEMRIVWDGAELPTYAHALGSDPDGPCGQPLVTRYSALAGSLLRMDAVVDADTASSGELTARADHELLLASRARLRVAVTLEERTDVRGLSSLELGDVVTAVLPAAFGGSQAVRVIAKQVSLEPPDFGHWSVELEGAN